MQILGFVFLFYYNDTTTPIQPRILLYKSLVSCFYFITMIQLHDSTKDSTMQILGFVFLSYYNDTTTPIQQRILLYKSLVSCFYLITMIQLHRFNKEFYYTNPWFRVFIL